MILRALADLGTFAAFLLALRCLLSFGGWQPFVMVDSLFS